MSDRSVTHSIPRRDSGQSYRCALSFWIFIFVASFARPSVSQTVRYRRRIAQALPVDWVLIFVDWGPNICRLGAEAFKRLDVFWGLADRLVYRRAITILL